MPKLFFLLSAFSAFFAVNSFSASPPLRDFLSQPRSFRCDWCGLAQTNPPIAWSSSGGAADRQDFTLQLRCTCGVTNNLSIIRHVPPGSARVSAFPLGPGPRLWRSPAAAHSSQKTKLRSPKMSELSFFPRTSHLAPLTSARG